MVISRDLTVVPRRLGGGRNLACSHAAEEPLIQANDSVRRRFCGPGDGHARAAARPRSDREERQGGPIEGECEMSDIWNYQSTDWNSSQDLTGYDVEATDGSIGKIDESSADAGRQQIVVDTGFWIFGKKRLIPAGAIRQIDHNDNKVFVGLTKDQVKDAPDFDETQRDESEFRSSHEQYYDSYRTF
jgi:hypothetical protein